MLHPFYGCGGISIEFVNLHIYVFLIVYRNLFRTIVSILSILVCFSKMKGKKVLSFPALYALYSFVLLELSLFVHFIAFCFYTIKVQKMCRGISGKTLYLHTLFFYHYQFNTYPKRYE
jgi:hypothetical protein